MQKNVIVTGGSSGIGEQIAKLLIQRECKVFVLSRRASSVVFEGCFSYDCDLSKIETIDKVLERITREHNIDHFDILVNCAGVGYATSLEKLTQEQYHQIMDVNLKGLIFMTKSVIPLMQRESVICNISSIAGIKGFEDWSIYCASKFGIEGFTKALRYEVRKKGIKVMIVRPGAVDTPLYHFVDDTEKQFFMKPETVASVIVHNLFLEKNACTEEIFINNSIGDI
ncbi:SDR family oxidoreductase [Patescibacteria group bacterium]|nr:SDR family oxidoreductase [Patescibacteria group bacterium]